MDQRTRTGLSLRKPSFRLLILALMGFACPVDAVTDADDVPPMILARRPDRIMAISDGYLVTYASGRSERWTRTRDGYMSSAGRFTRTATGYSGLSERYERSSLGWRRVSGGAQPTIHPTARGYLYDGSSYLPTAGGYYRCDARAIYATLPAGRTERKIIRMKNSTPSSFRRWSDRTAPPLK